MATQLVKKLGSKQILGNVGKVVKEKIENDGEVLNMYSLFGMANGIKTGSSTYGEWTALVGQMEAINHITGDSYAATVCFVPEPLCSILVNALRENDSVEFAFQVSVKRRDDLERGYEYIVTPIIESRQSDPLQLMREKAMAALPASAQMEIPVAPEAEAAKAPAKKAAGK